MKYYVANQDEFDAIKSNVQETAETVVRCRCQPNTCSRPVCRGCVGCLCRRSPINAENKALTEFFEI